MSVRICLLHYLGICHPQSTLGMHSGILKYLEGRYYRCHYSSKVCCHMDIFELRRKKKKRFSKISKILFFHNYATTHTLKKKTHTHTHTLPYDKTHRTIVSLLKDLHTRCNMSVSTCSFKRWSRTWKYIKVVLSHLYSSKTDFSLHKSDLLK